MKPVLPYRSEDINEGSAADLDLTHLDKNKALQAPATLKYRIDDVSNQRTVLDWTIVPTPANKNTLEITAEQNALFNRQREKQKMQVSVKTISVSGQTNQEDFYYNLIRIFEREDQLDA
jgi:hypothetical protein